MADAPDLRIASLEAQLAHERHVSRDAAAQLVALQHRETEIAQRRLPADMAPASTSGWTIDTLMHHLLALRDTDHRFYAERDRRYAEVSAEREKALQIKNAADSEALSLAREIQHYRDEQANNLRTQIENERGNYATKADHAALDDKSEARREAMMAALASAVGNWTREHNDLIENWRNSHAAVVGDIAAIRTQLAAQPEIRALERKQAGSSGEREGHVSTMVQAIAVGAVIVAALSIAVVAALHFIV